MLRAIRRLTVAFVVAVASVTSGCPETPAQNEGEGEASEGEGEAAEGEGEGELPPPPFAISTKNRLAWKRHRALETDLMAALALEKQEVCNELGIYSCVDFVHLVPLGGNEPFAKSQYEPLAAPTVTTPIAVDRVALSACAVRTGKDAAGAPVVFLSLDFAAAAVEDADADATIAELSRRLLAREATPGEIEELRDLTVDEEGAPVAVADFATLSCFAIATMSENLFY